ncbi:MAG: tetratricopeptide repeat protein [Planctomycetota bacterium]|jgi:hypothetical protein
MQVSTISMLCVVLLSLWLAAALLTAPRNSSLALGILRSLLLLISLLALACFVIYRFQVPLLQSVDRALVAAEVEPYRKRIDSATRMLEEDRDAALAELQSLAKELEGTNKRDRLHPLREEVLRALAHNHAAKQEYEMAASWAERWLDLDVRNMDAQIQSAQLLAQSIAGRNRARQQLRELHKRFPEVPRLARILLELLCEDKDFSAALRVLERSLSATRPLLWHSYYVSAQRAPFLTEFNEVNHCLLSANRDETGELTIEYDLPGDVSRVTLNLPHAQALRLSQCRLDFEDAQGTVQIPLIAEAPPLELFQVRREANTLVTDGGLFSHLIIDLPRPTDSEGASFKFRAHLQEEMPRPLAAFLLSNAGQEFTSAFSQSPNSDFLQRLLLEARLARPIFVRWAEEQTGLTQADRRPRFLRWKKASSNTLAFDLHLRLPRNAGYIDLQFPALSASQLRIDRILVEQGGLEDPEDSSDWEWQRAGDRDAPWSRINKDAPVQVRLPADREHSGLIITGELK